jgi:tetratricopeptide (TPR) repeat protein
MKKTTVFFSLLVLLGNSAMLLAQTAPEEHKSDAEKFQDSYYEALKQKGIENYDRALVSLEECLKLNPNEAAVFFEIGKNKLALKEYDSAYNSFEKATQLDPNNKWFWVGMYDSSYQNQDFEKAIATVNKLITFDEIYKENLVKLYMVTEQYDKALLVINELNEKTGKTDRRDNYKRVILSQGKYQEAEIENLKSQMDKYPKTESNYIDLIKWYTEQNDGKKALEITQKLAAEIPNSEWAQVGMFKYYLEKDEGAKAINSMNIVLASPTMDDKIKHRILNEFLIYVNTHPQYEPDLEKAIASFDTVTDVNVTKEIGKYYHSKKLWDKAIHFYELALINNSSDDLDIQLLLLQVHVDAEQFSMVAQKAASLIDTFPTQPQFYYFTGLAYNQLLEFKKAKDFLETGMDYVVDDVPLEINFNIQLGEAYSGLGDAKKKEQFFLKANQLLEKQK